MTPFKLRLCLLAVLVLSCSGIACIKRNRGTEIDGVTVLPVPEERNEAGWPVYEVKNEGFAVSLPSDWRHIDMNPATFEKGFEEMAKSNPEMRPMFANIKQQIQAGVKFLGMDGKTIGTGFATNVSVTVLPLPGAGGLDSAVDTFVWQANQIPGIRKPIKHERIRTAAGEGERFRYEMDMRLPAGQVRLVLIQYSFVSGGKFYSVTHTTSVDREAQYAPTFDKIGQSFRFIK